MRKFRCVFAKETPWYAGTDLSFLESTIRASSLESALEAWVKRYYGGGLAGRLAVLKLKAQGTRPSESEGGLGFTILDDSGDLCWDAYEE